MTFYTDKHVVVTGGAGFLGSHLVDLLLAQGARVTIVDDLRRGTHVNTAARLRRLDAGNPKALAPVFRGAFAVFNLAANVAGVIYNQANHLEMFHENLRAQLAPVLAAEAAGVEHFLQVSSVCVYAPEHNHPAIEAAGQRGEPVAANNGYSWAKRMGERAAQWSKIPHAVTVRPSNFYGPRDHFDERAHVIPAIIAKTLRDEIVQLNGTGGEVREFLYAADGAAGMLAALERGQSRGVYNLGAPESVTIRALAQRIQNAAGIEPKPIVFAAMHDSGDKGRWSSTEYTHAVTGWQAATPLDDGLRMTIEWYKEHRHEK